MPTTWRTWRGCRQRQLAHSAAQGWPAERYHELGAGWVVRSHQIEYLRPAFAGESLVVRTWVAGFRKVTSLRRYKIIRPADERVAGDRGHRLGLRELSHGPADAGSAGDQRRSSSS